MAASPPHQAPPVDTRNIESGVPLSHYCDNAVMTSKYNWYNLLPKAVWNQFRRLSNFYFLIVAAVSFIPNISPSSPITTTLPLIVVIGFGLARDVYEDFLRKAEDKKANNRPVMIRRRRLPLPTSTSFLASIIPKISTPALALNSDYESDDVYARVLQEGILSPEEYVVVRSRDIRVGDIVLATDDLQIPADLIVIQTAIPSGECFVSTANLDGESNLKRRVVPNIVLNSNSQNSDQQTSTTSRTYTNNTSGNGDGVDEDSGDADGNGDADADADAVRDADADAVRDISGGEDANDGGPDTSIENFKQVDPVVLETIDDEHIYAPVIVMAPPTPSLYNVQGNFCLRRGGTAKGSGNVKADSSAQLPEQTISDAVPLDERNILLRGSVLRNTGFVHGVAVYTGTDTKISQNMRDAPSKLGGVEKMMNRVVIALFLALLFLTAITSILAGVWQAQYGSGMWYMGEDRLLSGAVVGLRSVGTFIILYHTFVPVSLFVTLEFVRIVQGIFITADQYMQTNGKKGSTDVHANNLNETLGYVDHVFSDKTGTLTQNIMCFAACAVPVPDIIDAEHEGKQKQNAIMTSSNNNTTNINNPTSRNISTAIYDVREDPNALRNVIQQADVDFEYAPAAKLAEAMAVTHDVVPAHVAGHAHTEYQGESADEVALVHGAAKAGVVLSRRQSRFMYVSSSLYAEASRSADDGQQHRYEILASLDFTADRKRMSIVVRCPDGRVRVYCKGADSVLCPLLRSQQSAHAAQAASDRLSRLGLRTLVYSCRVLSDEESQNWLCSFRTAANAMDARAQQIEQVAAKIERDLDLVGVTGVEDRLQDEVPRTIINLRHAGVRVWMLTGDKVETAENIGYASSLLARHMKVTIISSSGNVQGTNIFDMARDRIREFALALESSHNHNSPLEFALIVDGTALTYILGNDDSKKSSEATTTDTTTASTSITGTVDTVEDPTHTGNHVAGMITDDDNVVDNAAAAELREEFVDVALRCSTVICARVTPMQKALVVRLVRNHRKHVKQKQKRARMPFSSASAPGSFSLSSTSLPAAIVGPASKTTLAIGDGGNDVSMIQEADVGVGIKGREGAQAARAADYAISEFRHLWRLIAVHGRFSYVRTCGVINLSLYKNVMFSCTQFLFQFFCFASGTTFHNQWLVTSWNAIVTLLPPFLYGIFERDLELATVMSVPQAYAVHHETRLFGFRSVAEFSLGYALWHANVLFWFVFIAFGTPARTVFSNGQDAGFFLTGLAASVLSVCIVLSKFLLCSHLWAYPVIIGTLLSFTFLWMLINIFPTVMHELPLEGALSRLFESPVFHLTWPVVFVAAFIPDFAVRLYRAGKYNIVERLQMLEARN